MTVATSDELEMVAMHLVRHNDIRALAILAAEQSGFEYEIMSMRSNGVSFVFTTPLAGSFTIDADRQSVLNHDDEFSVVGGIVVTCQETPKRRQFSWDDHGELAADTGEFQKAFQSCVDYGATILRAGYGKEPETPDSTWAA